MEHHAVRLQWRDAGGPRMCLPDSRMPDAGRVARAHRWCAFPVRYFRVRHRPWDRSHAGPHHRWIGAISPTHFRPPFPDTCPPRAAVVQPQRWHPVGSLLAPPGSACTPQASLWSPSVSNCHPHSLTSPRWSSAELAFRKRATASYQVAFHRRSIEVLAFRHLMCQCRKVLLIK